MRTLILLLPCLTLLLTRPAYGDEVPFFSSLRETLTNQLTIANVQASNTASYSVTVSNTLGSITSTPAMLNVVGKGITFTNPTPAPGDGFGFPVAAVGSDRVLIGAWLNNTATFTGAAYLFSTNGALLTTFTNPTPASFDSFGFAVAGVGSNQVVIGAGGDDAGADRAGAAYLFSTSGILLTTFTNPSPAIGDTFGHAVAAVGSDKILIAAPYDNTGASRAGAAYVFSTNGTLLTTITNPTPAPEDRFGSAVAALGSDLVIVGAPQDNTGAREAGSVYLFSTSGTLLTSITNPTPASGDWFGSAVAAVGNDRVVVAAPYENTGASDAGAAYLFSTNGTLLTTITNPTPAFGDEFGSALAAVGSDRVLIGASRDNTGAADAGAAYLFSTNGTLLTTFTNFTPANSELFGTSLTAVGSERVLIGTSGVGEAYLFELPGVLAPSTILTIGPAGVGQMTISWPDAPGFVLQERASLSPANWTNSASGATNPTRVPTTGSSKFYRLFKP